MSERLSDELVANLAVWAADAKPTTREVEALAREVQWWRNDDVLGVTAVFDLMNRHNITVEGIVALVDEVMDERNDKWRHQLVVRHVVRQRRLARGEEA